MESVNQKKKCMEVKGLSKTFFGKKEYVTVVDEVDFTVYEGEFLVILGPGRCGKTVLLNMIAGLETKTDGQILYNGKEVQGRNPDLAMVFQSLALLPFNTVMENTELPLKLRGISKKERRETAQRYIDLVGLTGFEKSYPSQLSGGMKQRAGIARAYTANPKILLMDEPFGQLDAQTRYAMQTAILKIWEKEKRTVIFVTNNIEEACYLGDRIILMSECPETVKQIYDLSDIPRPRDMVSDVFLTRRKMISDTMELSL